MAAGGKWSASYTVPGEAAGWYRVMANAYTHGPPDSGLFLFDDGLGEAWMHVSETDGRLADFFEDSVSSSVVGPATGWPTAGGAGTASRPDSNKVFWHPDSVFLQVVYTVGQGFEPAVGALVWATTKFQGPELGSAIVPESGIVAFKCAKDSKHVYVEGHALATELVQGRAKIISQIKIGNGCGKMLPVSVKAHRYLPWRLLNLAADTLQKHFGHSRGRIDWKLWRLPGISGSYYNPFADKITLNWKIATNDSDHFFWVSAHEYGHALHHKALGGGWFIRSSLQGCLNHSLDSEESHKCALQEGFANYAGTVGSGGYREDCFERFGEPRNEQDKRDKRESACTIESDRKPKVEGYVAALFVDLTDDTWEKGDWTEYPGKYVAEVFKTCHVKNRYNMPWPIPDVHIWWRGTNVSNIVWCLERGITPVYHEDDSVFGDIRTPVDVREGATEPPGWNRGHIRSTWLHNLN